MTARQTHRTVVTFAALAFVLGFAFLLTPIAARAGDVREADEFVAVGDPEELPPGWCYSDAVGTYPCHFQVKLPFDFDVDADGQCPEGFVLDRATGKCINDQLSVPEPVPADQGSAVIVQTRSAASDPDPFGCPEGWIAATPPLNPQLRCISDTIAVEQPGD